jgi:hypothetical protein
LNRLAAQVAASQKTKMYKAKKHTKVKEL